MWCNTHLHLRGYLNCGFTIAWKDYLCIENEHFPPHRCFLNQINDLYFAKKQGRACSCFHFDYNHLYHNLSQMARCLQISYSYKLPQHDKEFHMKQKVNTSHHSNLSIFTAVCGTNLFNATAFILPLQLGITWLRVLRKLQQWGPFLKEYKIYFQGMHTSEILADIPDILGKVRPVECNRNSSLCHHRESPGPTSLSFKLFRNIWGLKKKKNQVLLIIEREHWFTS